MGIRFSCPNGHKLNVKAQLAGRRAICPSCGAKVLVPQEDGTVEAALAPQSVAVAGPPLESVSAMIPVLDSPPEPPAGLEPISVPGIAAMPSLAGAVDPANAVAGTSAFAIQRRKRRKTQIKVAMVLFATTIVLAIILIWVLTRGSGQVEEGKAANSSVGPNRTAEYV